MSKAYRNLKIAIAIVLFSSIVNVIMQIPGEEVPLWAFFPVWISWIIGIVIVIIDLVRGNYKKG